MLDALRTAMSQPRRSGAPGFDPTTAVGMIDTRLDLVTAPTEAPDTLHAAMRFALLAPGKRLRPLFVVLLAGDSDAARDAACAVEMVHTASLVLDDLPCMDNAALRRGRETTHRRFGAATATLAAIALIARAFDLLAGLPVAPETRVALTQTLAYAIGRDGMAAGQDMDVSGLGRAETVNDLKTGALFVAAARMGAVLADLTPAQVAQIDLFARHFGAAFQIADDRLDGAEDPQVTGKDVGADGGKLTLSATAGTSEAWAIRVQHLLRAQAALKRAELGTNRLGALSALAGIEVPR